MKKILLIFIILFLNINNAYAEEFIDIKDHWAYEYILDLSNNDMINGYLDGSFKPSENIKIQDFLKILLEQDKRKLVKSGDKYPNWYIQTAKRDNLLDGLSIEDFKLPIKRYEMAKIIYNYLELNEEDEDIVFSDLSSNNYKTIMSLVKYGIISGYKDGTFKENNYVTRAEACKVLCKTYDIHYDLIINNKYSINSKNTNIGVATEDDAIKTRYEIVDNKIEFYKKDTKIERKNNYIDDKIVINLINNLVDNNSYVATLYTANGLFPNQVSVIYGTRDSYISNGSNGFEITFYEDELYDLSKRTNIKEFDNDIFLEINLGKTFDKISEYKGNKAGFSKRYLYKLEKAIETIFGKENKEDIINYIIDTREKARTLPDSEFEAKIKENKKIGKYKFNILCSHGDILTIYVSK